MNTENQKSNELNLDEGVNFPALPLYSVAPFTRGKTGDMRRSRGLRLPAKLGRARPSVS
jgi:hypothetical protein